MENVNLKIVLPVLILTLKVIMKLVVGRKMEFKNFLELLSELPSDIIFLAVSFAGVYVFLHDPIEPLSIIVFVSAIVVSLLVIAICRESRTISDSTISVNRAIFLSLIIALNSAISITCLFVASGQLQQGKCIIAPEKIENTEKTNADSSQKFIRVDSTKKKAIQEPKKIK